jgi:hypothetical protein
VPWRFGRLIERLAMCVTNVRNDSLLTPFAAMSPPRRGCAVASRSRSNEGQNLSRDGSCAGCRRPISFGPC